MPENCHTCGHDVEEHDLRGWHSDAFCDDLCHVCREARYHDYTYAQAFADRIAEAFVSANEHRLPVTA